MTQRINNKELQLAAKNASYEFARCQSFMDGWSHNLVLDLIDARAVISKIKAALKPLGSDGLKSDNFVEKVLVILQEYAK